ncbi:cell envelope protein SmpA [Pseudomonas sp. PB3P13]
MPLIIQCLVLTTLLCLALAASASSVHRCEASDGRVTFTTLSCAVGENLLIQEVRTFTPESIVGMMPEAEPRERSGSAIKRREPTVVGRSEDKCGNLISARERRDAIIHRRIVAGMSLQDVESALGKPDKVSIRNSATHYRYDTKRGRSAHIEFDERGCTKEKAKSRTAKSPR